MAVDRREIVNFSVPSDQLRSFRRELDKLGDDAPRAMSAAINRATKSTQGQIAKAIGGPSGILNLPVKAVRERGMRLTLKRDGGNITGAILSMRGARFSLARFAARQTAKGVAYKITRSGARQTIEKAWIADPNTRRPLGVGAVGRRRQKVNVVFGRIGSRYPVFAPHGPSVGEVALKSSEVRRIGSEELGTRLVHEAGRQVERFLRRRN